MQISAFWSTARTLITSEKYITLCNKKEICNKPKIQAENWPSAKQIKAAKIMPVVKVHMIM